MLREWVPKREMKFNTDKCKVMLMGKGNPNFRCTVMGSEK